MPLRLPPALPPRLLLASLPESLPLPSPESLLSLPLLPLLRAQNVLTSMGPSPPAIIILERSISSSARSASSFWRTSARPAPARCCGCSGCGC